MIFQTSQTTGCADFTLRKLLESICCFLSLLPFENIVGIFYKIAVMQKAYPFY